MRSSSWRLSSGYGGESSAGDGSCWDCWKDQRFRGFVPPTIRYAPCIIFVIGWQGSSFVGCRNRPSADRPSFNEVLRRRVDLFLRHRLGVGLCFLCFSYFISRFLIFLIPFKMPPTKTRVLQEDQNTTLKERLNSLQATTARARRNGAPPLTNGSSLKDVVSSTADTTSTNGGAQSNQNGASGVSCQPKSQAF